MSLSMWILYDELCSLRVKRYITDGDNIIEGFRIFTDDTEYSKSNLYIGKCSERIRSINKGFFLANGRDLIIVEDIDYNDILNRLIYIFEKYQMWDQKLKEAQHSSNPFQTIIDVAHEIVPHPMYFGQSNMHIFAITKQYTSEDVFVEWDEIKRINTIPLRFIERIHQLSIPSMFPDSLNLAIMPSSVLPDAKDNYKFTIRVNCMLNNKIWGHLYIFYKKNAVSKGAIQLIKRIMDAFESLLVHMHEHDRDVDSSYSYFKNLLNGSGVDDAVIQNAYESLAWNAADRLCVYKIVLSSRSFDSVLFNWTVENLNNHSANCIVFPYQNSIVVVVNKDHYEASILDSIKNILLLGDVYCSASLPFQNLKNLKSYYEQASLATEFSQSAPGEIVYFEDHAYSCVAKAFRMHVKWRDWIHPSLVRLKEIDEARGTEYFKTLYYYLKCGQHYENTAAKLFIHRNTLIYRIANIKSILDIDLKDENTLSYLKFCYELLEHSDSE